MISTIGGRKCSKGSFQFPITSKNSKPSSPQSNRSSLLQDSLRSGYKAMYHDKVKSSKIIALQRRFSSCGNLGRQAGSIEMDLDNCPINHVVSSRSSSFSKAPYFVSSLYHSVEQNLPVVQNSKLIHSSSVETPSPTFSSRRLRSGSCPQVWTSIILTGQVSLHNNTLSSSNQDSHAPISNKIKHYANSRKNSVPCFDKIHSINLLPEKCWESSIESKMGQNKTSAHSISFGSTDSNIALEKDDAHLITYSSYEDLNEEPKLNIDSLRDNKAFSKAGISNFSSQSLLKRTLSTECFNFRKSGLVHKCGTNDFPQTGLTKFVRNSFFSNSDIYNLKSPVETKPINNKLPCGLSSLLDDKQTIKGQGDGNIFHHRIKPNLVKTSSEQHLSSLKKNYVGKSLDSNEDISISNSVSFDKKPFNSPNKNSVYVSSVFLNLNNSQSQKHETRLSSASPPTEDKSSSFSRRPSTLGLGQISHCNSRALLPTSVSPYSRKKHDNSTFNVLKTQQVKFEMLLKYVKEAITQKDILRNDVRQMENALIQNKQFLSLLKPYCVQELKRSNFALKSDIIRLTHCLEVHYEDNDGVDNEDMFLYDCYDQKWSYNPSYDGRH